jgi:hypothetical protein
MLRIKLIKNKSFKEFLMPSYIEYWRTLSYSTCQQYKSYKNIVRFRKNLSKHATKNGVTLINSPGDNDYQNFINNIIKPKARRAAEDNGIAFRAKRVRLPKIEIAQAPMVVDDALRPTRANASASASVTQQPIAQALALVQEADSAPVPMVQLEQPMADAAPVPMIQFGQPMAQEQVLLLTGRVELGNEMNVQPMEQVQTLVQEAEQPIAQALAIVQEADAATVQALIASSTAHLPNSNGARKPLVLNGITIEVDPDTFMVNATMMCKAAGKRWVDYYDNNKTKSYIQYIETKVRIRTFDLIRSKPGHNGGTMVHRLIAYDLASWLSQDVKLQFYMWNDELRIENAALSTQIEELQAATVIAPPSAHLPNANGARKPLVLNGIAIEVDSVTFMVNATQMCRAAGKLYGHYWELVTTKKYVQELSLDIGIPISKLVQRNQSGRGTSQDTNVHFKKHK